MVRKTGARNTGDKRWRGYSLIELMIVISLIGIVATIAVPSYQSSIAMSMKHETISYLLTLQLRQEQYWLSEGLYADVSVLPLPNIEGVTITQHIASAGSYTISATLAFLSKSHPCRELIITPIQNYPEACWSH